MIIPDAEPLPILTEGDARLRQPARPVESLGGETIREVARCFATLAAFRRRHGFGRALAAPQLGIPLRLIAVDLGAGPFAVINPQIRWRSEETFELWDDCFSVPDKIVRVRRHRSISLDCRDEQFRIRRWERLPPDLAELLQHPKVVALGEIGLDYHYDFSPRDVQRRVFAAQLQLAAQTQKAIVIHTREAWEDTVNWAKSKGFEMPLVEWMKNELKEEFFRVLLEPRTLQRGYFKPAAVQQLVQEHVSGRRNRSGLLWRMLVLELWHRNFLEGSARTPAPTEVAPVLYGSVGNMHASAAVNVSPARRDSTI